MNNYEYIIAGLPSLQPGATGGHPAAEQVIQSIREQLSDKDNGTPLSGRYSINLKTGTVTPAEDLVSSSVQVRLAEDVTLSSASQSFYMAALPADLTGKDVYVVVAMEQADENGGVTSVTIPVKVAGKNLEAGKKRIK